jgi:CRISPR system Cascade subunit CasB
MSDTTSPAEPAAEGEGESDDPAGMPKRTGRVGLVVARQASRIQSDYLSKGQPGRQASGTAALARLRRGLGKQHGSIPEILVYTQAAEFLFPGCGDEPTRGERAAHLAMTLYALHQQSRRDRGMHRPGAGLGSAVRTLVGNAKLVDPVPPTLRRFNVLATASSFDQLSHHLRGMVQLLRAGNQPLDYGLLADQLYRWQGAGGPDQVRLAWGRDFYLTEPKPATT